MFTEIQESHPNPSGVNIYQNPSNPTTPMNLTSENQDMKPKNKSICTS